MNQNEGRFFNEYDELKRLTNQIELYKELESRGYEKYDKRILTTRNLGVPITIMLLLIKEASKIIAAKQNELIKSVIHYNSITTNKIQTEYGLEILETNQSTIPTEWEHTSSLYPSGDSYISGSTVSRRVENFIPKTQINILLSDIFKSSKKYMYIYRDYIQVVRMDEEKIPNINLFKSIAQLFEY